MFFFLKDSLQDHSLGLPASYMNVSINGKNNIGNNHNSSVQILAPVHQALHQIINYVKDKIGVVFLRSCVIFDTL